MRFPEKPIATAGLGIACGLALLAVLSWPGIAGSNGSPILNAEPASSGTSSTVTTDTISETTVTTLDSSSAGNASYGLGQGNISTPPSGASSTRLVVTTVANNGQTIQSETTAGTHSSNQPLFGFASTTQSIASQNHSYIFDTLAILTIIAVGVALGSMLFIRTRMSAE